MSDLEGEITRMKMVDVKVPSIGRTYNFSLEEHTPIETLIAEMVEVICQKESCHLTGDMGQLVLCSLDQKQILPRGNTLRQSQISDGCRLLLV